MRDKWEKGVGEEWETVVGGPSGSFSLALARTFPVRVPELPHMSTQGSRLESPNTTTSIAPLKWEREKQRIRSPTTVSHSSPTPFSH